MGLRHTGNMGARGRYEVESFDGAGRADPTLQMTTSETREAAQK